MLNPTQFSDIFPMLGWMIVHAAWIVALAYLAVLLVDRYAPRTKVSTRYWFTLGAMVFNAIASVVVTYIFHRDGGGGAEVTQLTTVDLPAHLPIMQHAEAAEAATWGLTDAVLPYIGILWMIGLALLTLRLAFAMYYPHFMWRKSISCTIQPLLKYRDEISKHMGITRTIDIRITQRAVIPSLVGWMKPYILMPVAIVNQLSTEELELIIAHELAHFRRYDHIGLLCQRVIETLLYFHPLIWLMSKRLDQYREEACDDIVVGLTGRQASYARTLYKVQAWQLSQQRGALALGLAKHQTHLLHRIQRLLHMDTHTPNRFRSYLLPLLLIPVLIGAWAFQSIHEMPDEQASNEPTEIYQRDFIITDQHGDRITAYFMTGQDVEIKINGEDASLEQLSTAQRDLVLTLQKDEVFTGYPDEISKRLPKLDQIDGVGCSKVTWSYDRIPHPNENIDAIRDTTYPDIEDRSFFKVTPEGHSMQAKMEHGELVKLTINGEDVSIGDLTSNQRKDLKVFMDNNAFSGNPFEISTRIRELNPCDPSDESDTDEEGNIGSPAKFKTVSYHYQDATIMKRDEEAKSWNELTKEEQALVDVLIEHNHETGMIHVVMPSVDENGEEITHRRSWDMGSSPNAGENRKYNSGKETVKFYIHGDSHSDMDNRSPRFSPDAPDMKWQAIPPHQRIELSDTSGPKRIELFLNGEQQLNIDLDSMMSGMKVKIIEWDTTMSIFSEEDFPFHQFEQDGEMRIELFMDEIEEHIAPLEEWLNEEGVFKFDLDSTMRYRFFNKEKSREQIEQEIERLQQQLERMDAAPKKSNEIRRIRHHIEEQRDAIKRQAQVMSERGEAMAESARLRAEDMSERAEQQSNKAKQMAEAMAERAKAQAEAQRRRADEARDREQQQSALINEYLSSSSTDSLLDCAQTQAKKHYAAIKRIKVLAVQDGYIKDGKKSSLMLSTSKLKINGRKMPADVHQRYLKHWEDGLGEPIIGASKFTIRGERFYLDPPTCSD